MDVQAVLVVLFMFASTVKTDENGDSVKVPKGKVEFWRKTVTLTCPGELTWHDKKTMLHGNKKYQIEYTQPLKGYCEYKDDTNKDIKYHFYVKGKACENCFELDATLFMVIIIVDVVGTAVVMMMIYKCSKKTSSDKPAHSPKPPLPSGHRPPPTAPPRDYESLNPHTRAADTYSTVVNRMG